MAHDLYRELVLARYRNPHNRGVLEQSNAEGHSYNPLCGDELSIYAQVEGSVLKDAAFEARGCSIVQASADLMIDLLRGRSVDDVPHLAALFAGMMEGRDTSAEAELGEIQVLREVRRFPVRVKCALLPWSTLKDALAGLG